MHRGRFAPTPSGELHLGSLVCALASFLDSRKRNGEWLVRIEDIDTNRCRPEFESLILRQLERHGLHWDGPIVRQSERSELYSEHIRSLQERGLLYRCSCSRAFLKSSGCRLNSQGEVIYPGYCRSSLDGPAVRSSSEQFALRFVVHPGDYRFEDVLSGWVKGNVKSEVGDFVICRADGCASYHLAVVVDDHEQAVTRVIRGADILPLTGRQLLLQDALNLSTPVYGHIPLVMGEDGAKLSKSSSAKAIREGNEISNLIDALSFLGIGLNKADFRSVTEVLDFAIESYSLT